MMFFLSDLIAIHSISDINTFLLRNNTMEDQQNISERTL